MQKTVTIYDREEYDGEWPPEGIEAFAAWLVAKIAEIPEEHRAKATIEITSEASYDSSKARVCIEYMRPETDAEIAEKNAEQKRRKNAEEARERQQLAALKAKYGQ